jgi:starch synthase/alpha-amylase
MFQREVINNIIPHVQPDLIHCNDWMTGLIPAMARQMGIPCLFTVHNVHTVKTTLAFIEDRGIDAAAFWRQLFFEFMADRYETARETNPIDLLTSGVFAAHFVNVVSPNFLAEIVDGRHGFVYPPLRQELANKVQAACAAGILNAPDPSFNPARDKELKQTYGPKNHIAAKKENKRYLQKKLGLIQDDRAPIFFWPSRLDPIQKGCQLLGDILYKIIRVAIYDFDFHLEHQAYAACDFILMPSSFEPCGLPQMIAPLYGTLPVAHDTGGIHDTISHLDVAQNSGNGFLFKNFDSGGLWWAIEQAMHFYNLPKATKGKQIRRIMQESAAAFTHANTARQYIKLYEKMLKRPLFLQNVPNPGSQEKSARP